MRALPNLDLLRACAVLSVVIEHLLLAYGVKWIGFWEVQWIGIVGVFLFFVHTSLVLMWSLERKPHTLDFYIRRIFRIYPLAWLAIGAALLFHAPVTGDPQTFFHYAPPHGVVHKLLPACLLVSNLFRGYLPLSVMWSLPYEVEMYLVLPLLFFFIQRNFSLWPLLVYWVFTVLVCRSLFPGAGHNFFLCIPYFLPGIMAYVGFGRHKPLLPSWSLPIALLLMWYLFMIKPSWRHADLLCLAVGLGLPFFHQISARWLIRCSHQVAKYSYGIYLAHPFALVLGLYLLPHKPLALQLTVFFASLIIISVSTYHLLEKPMIDLGSRIAGRAEKRYEQHQLADYRIPATRIDS
ncbi:MAG TPA: acyltransferase [Acidobacteriaceae bacterium]|jgi:peptidoglycan/LPS O-acetylase OafA/YrhL|nr:acyltransferase [Acidobacteriaceae bacterium]